jgi:hypothetical protein
MSIEIVRARDLLAVLHSEGWKVVSAIAEESIKAQEQEVILCDDETKVVGLQRKAQAARMFWETLKSRCTSSTQLE